MSARAPCVDFPRCCIYRVSKGGEAPEVVVVVVVEEEEEEEEERREERTQHGGAAHELGLVLQDAKGR